MILIPAMPRRGLQLRAQISGDYVLAMLVAASMADKMADSACAISAA